jgi:hypothetical protein
VTKKNTTQEHNNKIIELRQAIHDNGFGNQRDALSEVLDATCLTGAISSFPLLCLSKAFRRQWHSLYKAVERGTVDDEWLSHHLAQQVPQEGSVAKRHITTIGKLIIKPAVLKFPKI